MLSLQTHQDRTTLPLCLSPSRMVQLEHSRIQPVQWYGPCLSFINVHSLNTKSVLLADRRLHPEHGVHMFLVKFLHPYKNFSKQDAAFGNKDLLFSLPSFKKQTSNSFLLSIHIPSRSFNVWGNTSLKYHSVLGTTYPPHNRSQMFFNRILSQRQKLLQ